MAGTTLDKHNGDFEKVERQVILNLRKALRGEVECKNYVNEKGQDDYLLDGPAMFVVAMTPEWSLPLDDRTAENVASVVQNGLLEARSRNYDVRPL